jgi:foldase protein PrsA
MTRARPSFFAPIALVLVAFSACSSAVPPAATVDGVRITDAQLGHDVPLFRFLSTLNNSTCGQPVSGETDRSACARLTLANVIQEDLVKEYAASHHVTVPADQVQSTVDQLVSSLGAEQLDAKLKQEGLTRADLTALAGRLLLFGAVQKEVAAERVTDEQLRSAYQQQRTSFTQIHARHILVGSEALANKIESEVTRKNFTTLAKRYSTDTGSAANGGDLGTLSAAALDPEFVAGALALQPGQISPPVHTQFGWHIILLVDVQTSPFDEVKQQLLEEQSSQAFDDWLKERLSRADITVNPKYGRLDPSTGEILPIRSTATGSPEPSGSPSPALSASP